MKKLTFVGFWLISVDLRLTKVSVIPVVIPRAATEVDADALCHRVRALCIVTQSNLAVARCHHL
jgi:hypothetical protein